MPKLTSRGMAANHLIDTAWCAGCGLYAHVNQGKHRADCTKPPTDSHQEGTTA